MDLTVDPSQFAMFAILFLLSLFVLDGFVFKPTLKILKERHKKMKGLSKEAEYFEEQYLEKLAAYDKLMQEARGFAKQSREEILKLAAGEQKQIISEAQKMAEEFLSHAKSEISVQTKEAKLILKSRAQELAKSMVTKLLKKQAA